MLRKPKPGPNTGLFWASVTSLITMMSSLMMTSLGNDVYNNNIRNNNVFLSGVFIVIYVHVTCSTGHIKDGDEDTNTRPDNGLSLLQLWI